MFNVLKLNSKTVGYSFSHNKRNILDFECIEERRIGCIP